MSDVMHASALVDKPSMALWKKIVIGMVAGMILGVFLGPQAEYLKPIGTLFISAIKMLIVPLVFCSLVVGVTSMKDSRKMGRVSLKAFTIYLLTTALAVAIGLVLGAVFEPGSGIHMTASAAAQEAKAAPKLVDIVLGLIPTNPVESLSSGNILQIIVFAIGLGFSLNLIGEHGEPVVKVFNGFAEAMYKLTELVMKFAPYGVFALMAWVAGKFGIDVLLPLIKVIAVVYVGCLLQMLLVYTGAITFIARLNPLPFLKGILDAQTIAFTSTSSSGTLPVSMRAAEEKLGVSKGIAGFVLPMGATINMDGTAIYQGVTALFIAQAYGIDLSMSDYITIILTATLASIGTAGVPGAGLIMLSLVLSTVGLPLEGLAIVAGIDRILDMARTLVNVTGDLMVSVLVGKSEKELDETVYYSQSENQAQRASR